MKGLRLWSIATLALPLAACMTPPPVDVSPPVDTPSPASEPGQACNSDAGQAFIGRTATAETGAQMLAATGARSLRWVAPGMAVTMDFRADRLTVGYDDKMIITSVACG